MPSLATLSSHLDTLSQRLTNVMARGSTDTTVNAVLDEMSAIEARLERMAELIEAGTPEDEAEAEVTGDTLEVVRRRNFVRDARAQGARGAGFDALVTDTHRRLAVEAHSDAMNACVGYMNRTNRTDNGYRFWFASDATVRKHATDELLEWFAANGRLTRAALRESILTGRTLSTYQGGR